MRPALSGTAPDYSASLDAAVVEPAVEDGADPTGVTVLHEIGLLGHRLVLLTPDIGPAPEHSD